MVFRGKPSKACQRCRDRRLKCNFARPACGSCVRAGEPCAGYRDANTIRFDDQTDFIRTKAQACSSLKKTKQNPGPMKLRHLPQDIQVLGREMFFAYYVSDFSHAWDFLFPYLNLVKTPEHLSLGIDAVSLAFLSHQVSSPTAKQMGTRKYVEALRKINKVVQDPEAASEVSTLETALLLDLFEKMMISNSQANASRHAHVEGALALVKLRGIEHFRQGPEVRALLGLSLNATICSLSTGRPIPPEVRQIRRHASQFVDTSYPKWRLSECILDATDPLEGHEEQIWWTQERLARSASLDRRLETIALEAGPAWSFERKFVSSHDQRVLVSDGFYDVYPNRTITQMWNVLRVTRIQICEEFIDTCSIKDDQVEGKRAKQVIAEMVREICASCPQMTNCDFVARDKLPSGTTPGSPHTHTMSHMLDVYILIFGLYVVAWSRHRPQGARDWAVGQLEHIADHFGIKEAANILLILRKQEGRQCAEPWEAGPWYIYRLLGSHAFAAS